MNLAPLPDSSIRTSRCTLEPLTSAHAEPLFPGLRDPGLYGWIPTRPPTKVDDLRQRFQRLQSRASDDKQQLWLNWAVLRNGDQCYVGTVEVTVFPDKRAQLAYFVFTAQQRQGYAAEACETIMEYVFENYQLRQLFLLVDTRNLPSIRLAERLGFQRTATILNADSFNGSTSDEYRYEWARARAPGPGMHAPQARE